MRLKEIFAALSVMASLVGVPLLIRAYHNAHVFAQYPPGTKVITLTGVGDDGVWTVETVDASNYWWKTFSAATLRFEEGDQVVLRLQSADVHHRFYAPELGVGPIDVEPGHTEIVQFKVGPPGVYQYYCTSMCGDCHFYMRGWIVVGPPGEDPGTPEPVVCRHDFDKPPKDDMVRWGQYLHQKLGCITCHGTGGRGNVENPNYVKGTIPSHNTLAEKFFLEEKEDADAFLELLLERTDFDNMGTPTDIPRFKLVLAQYRAAKDLIRKGKNCAKRDPAGPEPPLQMPSWREFLTERDIDSIIAYLITLYPWEDEE